MGSGVSAVEDKENCPVRGSARLAGKESIDHCGSDGVNDETQMSGKKRGGGDIEIEKQKSFTGSYFQVSGGSLDDGGAVQLVGRSGRYKGVFFA